MSVKIQRWPFPTSDTWPFPTQAEVINAKPKSPRPPATWPFPTPEREVVKAKKAVNLPEGIERNRRKRRMDRRRRDRRDD
jgi:hypothetical protein